MHKTKHPLLEKQLTKSPHNWKEWLQQWEASKDPLTLQALILHGPEMVGAKHWESREDAVRLYLRLATQFYSRKPLFGESCPDNEPTIFTCPRHSLAKSAFQTLLKWRFKKKDSDDEPWHSFLYNHDGNLNTELVSFLGLDSPEIYTEEDPLHRLFYAARERYQDILKEFCVEFSKQIIVPEFSGSQDDKNRRHWLDIWQPHKRHAVKALWFFDELDFLIERRDEVDEETLMELKGLILSQKVKTSFSPSVLRRPKTIEEILSNVHGIFDVDKKLKKAACVYLGLTAK